VNLTAFGMNDQEHHALSVLKIAREKAAAAKSAAQADNNPATANASDWALVHKILSDGFPDAFDAVRAALVHEKEKRDAALAATRTCVRCGAICDR
jgi:hypothetical protein